MPRRPKHAPTPSTRAVVRALAAFGINQEHIAARLGCNLSTLLRNYRDDLDQALPDMIAKVAQSLYQRAIDPRNGMAGVKASELILKARGGWRDNFQQVEHLGADGSPIGSGQQVVLILPENSRDLPPAIIARSGARPALIEHAPLVAEPLEGVFTESE